MRYKLFAVDLDGTLLSRQSTIRDEDFQAVTEIQAQGVQITIVTGRMYSGTKHIAQQIGALCPVACVDGAHIVDAGSDEELFHEGLVGPHAHHIREVLGQHNAAYFVFSGHTIIHDTGGNPYLPYVKYWSEQLDHHPSVTDHPCWDHPRGVTEVLCVGEHEPIHSAHEVLQERVGESAQIHLFPVAFEQPTWAMVIRHARPTKGTAIRWLCERFNCELDEVAVVGDWLNDVPMFEVAGRSFAMGHAPETVKRVATDVLESTVETGGGIAEAARKLGLIT
jgi:Cof subfamily protein (haloacid dehalogenase superfamily)